jgi:fumigallin biosynthesis monooxygenase-like protein
VAAGKLGVDGLRYRAGGADLPSGGGEVISRIDSGRRRTALPAILASRATAQIDGDFVVFLIGMRINRPWKLGKWLPMLSAMPRMLKELEAAAPEIGFLGSTGLGLTTLVQYWRSFDHLEAYARARDKEHWPAWVAFNRRTKDSCGAVGIWHETYLVRAGEYETVYSGMPLMGLAKASRRAEVTTKTESARERLGGGKEA